MHNPQDESSGSAHKLVGSIIDRKYKILNLVGSGGMGAVFKASHILTGKIYALKVMHEHMVTSEKSVQRFQREAKATMALSHPNIITVHDFGIESDTMRLYMSMEFLAGLSLSTVIRTEGPLTFFRALPIFRHIALGLQHAHETGVIHRDLKPSNVMLITDKKGYESVKVVDFGIAKILRSEEDGLGEHTLTRTDEMFGSPLYMSPEQCASAKDIDARSDIYSLGCVMFEVLTGAPPFQGNGWVEVAMQHSSADVPPIKLSETEDIRVRNLIKNVIQKCLEKRADDRFSSMSELCLAIEEAMQLTPKGSKILAKAQESASVADRLLNKQFGRHKGLILSLSAALLLSVCIVGTVLYDIYGKVSGPNELKRQLQMDIFTPEKKIDQAASKRLKEVFKKRLSDVRLVDGKNSEGYAYANVEAGDTFRNDGDWKSANEYYMEAYAILKQLNKQNSPQAATFYRNYLQCAILDHRSDLGAYTVVANDAIDIFKRQNNSIGVFIATALWGKLNEDTNDGKDAEQKYDRALAFYFHSLDKQSAYYREFVPLLLKIGNFFLDKSRSPAATQNDIPRAVSAYKAVIQLTANDKTEAFAQAVAYNQLGLLAAQRKNLTESQRAFQMSVDLLSNDPEKYQVERATVLLNLADSERLQGDVFHSLSHRKEANNLAPQIL